MKGLRQGGHDLMQRKSALLPYLLYASVPHSFHCKPGGHRIPILETWELKLPEANASGPLCVYRSGSTKGQSWDWSPSVCVCVRARRQDAWLEGVPRAKAVKSLS